ncbi:hypothetical protein HDU93_007029 [Gonapodya sp. JEL0774]|nr:hypothetical protein HDU93_007029 [Gonapodya sp. JEL0774]
MSTAPDRPAHRKMACAARLSLASALVALFSLAVIAPAPTLAQTTNPVPAPTLPWLGASLDWNNDSPLSFSSRIGRSSLLYMWFMAVPIEDGAFEYLKTKILREPFPANGTLVVTMEPVAGLSVVTDAEVVNIVKTCKTLNDAGISVLLRWAHEMNGDWYRWGIQPALYRQVFQTVATAVHAGAPKTAMLWSPNIGVTYPYAANSSAVPGTADFLELDTNKDGVVDVNDDPYGPFWPGDQYVDWVGMSLYWTGSPFGQNTIPFENDFSNSIRGKDPQTGVKISTPDFYEVYSVGKNKPFIITETGAMHVDGRTGPDELTIKRAWWQQTITAPALTEFPMMKGMLLYEVTVIAPREFNTSVNISYAYTRNSTIRDPFVLDLPYDSYTFGPATAFTGYSIDTTPIAMTGTLITGKVTQVQAGAAGSTGSATRSTTAGAKSTSTASSTVGGVMGSSSGTSTKTGGAGWVGEWDSRRWAVAAVAALVGLAAVVA